MKSYFSIRHHFAASALKTMLWFGIESSYFYSDMSNVRSLLSIIQRNISSPTHSPISSSISVSSKGWQITSEPKTNNGNWLNILLLKMKCIYCITLHDQQFMVSIKLQKMSPIDQQMEVLDKSTAGDVHVTLLAWIHGMLCYATCIHHII